MKKCKNCGREFGPKNPKGKFCSDKCRVYSSRQKKIVLSHAKNIVSAMEEVKLIEKGEVKPILMEDWLTKQFQERLVTLRREIANPPKNPIIGLRKYLAVRENEIKDIQSKLNQ